jgi:hypothetical protein
MFGLVGRGGTDHGGVVKHRTPTATPGATTADRWVDTSGGSCAATSGGVYVNASACASFDNAWDAVSAGGTIRVKAGTYNWQRITGNKASTTKIIAEDGTTIFKSDALECQAVQGGESALCFEGTNIWVENVDIDINDKESQGICVKVWSGASNGTLKDVNCDGDYPAVEIQAANFRWLGGMNGDPAVVHPPLACGPTPHGNIPFLTTSEATGFTIDHVVFSKRQIQSTPTPNQGTCGADGIPHQEDIRLEGNLDNLTISNSYFQDGSDGGSGHIFANGLADPDNVLIYNTYWGEVDGNYLFQVTSTTTSNWTWLYNYFGIAHQSGGQRFDGSDSSWVFVGNLVADVFNCTGTHTKNVRAGSGTCGTDTFIGATDVGVTEATGRLQAGSPAINAAETPSASDYCTGAQVGSIDREGDARPFGSICDAGPDEYTG